jgi:hypothetical protein
MKDASGLFEAVSRPITEHEGQILKWLLQHGVPGSEQFMFQIDSLSVISKCTCGCPTVDFSLDGPPASSNCDRILADCLATVDGQDVGVILFQRNGRLRSLEVYSMAGSDQPFGLPKTETLFPWEELSKRPASQTREHL